MPFDRNFFSEVNSMLKAIATAGAIVTLATILAGALPTAGLRAEDTIEKAGVAIGVTAGNAVFLPSKALNASMGLFFGALSFVLTGGDTEVTQQMWRYSTAEPYLITPEVARKAIGRRPELSETDSD
jgi:hypothetical protein